MKILVVDDEELIRNVIKEYLLHDGYSVSEASDGDEAVSKAKEDSYDLIIMDIMMPHKDGFSACKEIKEFDPDVPFIMLSARTLEEDKLAGFELGIDDYVTKPFSPKELIARIKVILKRNNKEIDNITIKGIKIDDKAHSVTIDGKDVYLTLKEYDLLKYFIMNKNIALTRDQLLTSIWNFDFDGDNRTVDTHVKMLRKHLGKYGYMIKTVRGVGYKFDVNEE